MAFDACEHKIRQLVIRAGKEIRKAKGLPEELNVTTLFNETAPMLGVPVIQFSSERHGNHLPAPHEMKKEDGGFIVPRKDCPICNQKQSVILAPLCTGCEDAEGGKYKSVWKCLNPLCKGFKEKSEKAFVQWLNELGIEIPNGPKANFGIRTMTNEGLK